MRTIIHDLKDEELDIFNFNEEDNVIPALKCNDGCVGCFSCWIKSPTKCVIKDDYSGLANYLKKSDKLIIITKNRYGCYSFNVKRILERCIGYVLPYFTIRNNEVHHKTRYDNKLNLEVYFYGEYNDDDKAVAEKLVKANGINLNVSDYNIKFYKDYKEIIKCIRL